MPGLIEVPLGYRARERQLEVQIDFTCDNLPASSLLQHFPGGAGGQSLMKLIASVIVMPSTRISQSRRLPCSLQPKQ
jgi:hypothetical protein